MIKPESYADLNQYSLLQTYMTYLHNANKFAYIVVLSHLNESPHWQEVVDNRDQPSSALLLAVAIEVINSVEPELNLTVLKEAIATVEENVTLMPSETMRAKPKTLH